MRAYFFKTGWLFLLVFCLSGTAHIEAKALGPVMVIDKRSFDFKEVKEGSTVEHTFGVLNKGDQVLEIDKVKPS